MQQPRHGTGRGIRAILIHRIAFDSCVRGRTVGYPIANSQSAGIRASAQPASYWPIQSQVLLGAEYRRTRHLRPHLRLRAIAYLFGACTSRSAGFSRSRMSSRPRGGTCRPRRRRRTSVRSRQRGLVERLQPRDRWSPSDNRCGSGGYPPSPGSRSPCSRAAARIGVSGRRGRTASIHPRAASFVDPLRPSPRAATPPQRAEQHDEIAERPVSGSSSTRLQGHSTDAAVALWSRFSDRPTAGPEGD
jgi:hypothetical protein